MIARLIAPGHTDQEIGVEIHLDRAVVAEEVEHLRAALGLATRLQIAVPAMQPGPAPGHGHARPEANRTDDREASGALSQTAGRC